MALRNPHEESGASLVFAIVQEILTHDEDGVPYKHVTRHDPASRTITPHEGGFAVLAEPIAESHNSATSLLKDAQLQVFDRVNNILALPTRTKDDLLTDARLYADK
ncbi:hypothetical protein [Nocardiopsis synnemataformans]|uniref:hypothetical protein n=1 Tax=Nocardiopsis synnemataformans TaxID=61305 RepID=UPI003EB7EEC7